jgi:hypothetical protein
VFCLYGRCGARTAVHRQYPIGNMQANRHTANSQQAGNRQANGKTTGQNRRWFDLRASDLSADAMAYIKRQCNSIAKKEVADGKGEPERKAHLTTKAVGGCAPSR